jgi:hypothetical protein
MVKTISLPTVMAAAENSDTLDVGCETGRVGQSRVRVLGEPDPIGSAEGRTLKPYGICRYQDM